MFCALRLLVHKLLCLVQRQAIELFCLFVFLLSFVLEPIVQVFLTQQDAIRVPITWADIVLLGELFVKRDAARK